MKSRCDWQDTPDDLDRLLSHALRAATNNVRPPSRLAHRVCAAVEAQGPLPVERRTSLWATLRQVWGTLALAQSVPSYPLYAHDLPFVDLGEVSPRLVWWFDMPGAPRGRGRQNWSVAR